MRSNNGFQIGTLPILLALAASCGGGGNGPPVIQKLEANLTKLSDSATVSILATVTDPDGPADLAGGTLHSQSGTFVGAFTAKSNGLFQLDLGWPAFAAVEPFDFYGSTERTYRVSFTDLQGHEATKDLPLTFVCPDRSGGCGSACRRLDVNEACGSCTVQCPVGQECDPPPAQPACVPRSVPFEDFPSTLGADYCARIFACCNATELQSIIAQGNFTDQQTCTAYAANTFNQGFDSWRAAIAAGRGVYDPLEAGSCLTSFEQSGCSGGMSSNFLVGCDNIYHGTQSVDAACASSAECAPGTTCLTPPGTCKAYLGLNATCGQAGTAPCDSKTLYCDTVTHKCTVLKAENDTCAPSDQCQNGLECTGGKCVPSPPVCDGK